MAVRTDWSQIQNGIDLMCFAYFRQGSQVVDVNKALGNLAIWGVEIKSADATARAVRCNALPPGFRVPFVSANCHAVYRPQ
jgi:hypothetical protein